MKEICFERTQCPKCNSKLKLKMKDIMKGKIVSCPKCGSTIELTADKSLMKAEKTLSNIGKSVKKLNQ